MTAIALPSGRVWRMRHAPFVFAHRDNAVMTIRTGCHYFMRCVAVDFRYASEAGIVIRGRGRVAFIAG